MQPDTSSKRRRETSRLLLYGAAAEPPAQARTTGKVHLKLLMDRVRFKLGLVNQINYRNYERASTYNRGDHAIIVAAGQQIRSLLPAQTTMPVNWGDLSATRPTHKDKLLVCGSGYFFPTKEGLLPPRITADLHSIKSSTVELHFLGVGYNRLLKWPKTRLASESATALRELLEAASTVTVRDSPTKRFLQEFTQKQITVTGDPALFIAPQSRIAEDQTGYGGLRISVTIPFHGPASNQWLRDHLVDFIKALKIIRSKTQCEFFYIVHYDSELVIAALIADSGVPIKTIHVDATKLPDAYARMDMHIGGMLHSCILAAASGVPSVGLAYDSKHYGFFELMNSLPYCMNGNLFNVGSFVDNVLRLLDDLETQSARIKRRRDELARTFAETILRIARDNCVPSGR